MTFPRRLDDRGVSKGGRGGGGVRVAKAQKAPGARHRAKVGKREGSCVRTDFNVGRETRQNLAGRLRLEKRNGRPKDGSQGSCVDGGGRFDRVNLLAR